MTRGFLRFLRRNTIGLLALFVALGGTTYAASTALLPKNSVGSSQVINGSLKTRDLSKTARRALKGNRGHKGGKGDKGVKGDTGTSGATNVVIRTNTVSIGADSRSFAVATCNAGERATGGGARFTNLASTNELLLVYSYPKSAATSVTALPVAGEVPTAWQASAYNALATAQTLNVFVVCASP